MLLMRKQSRDEYSKVVSVPTNLEEMYVGAQMCPFFWKSVHLNEASRSSHTAERGRIRQQKIDELKKNKKTPLFLTDTDSEASCGVFEMKKGS